MIMNDIRILTVISAFTISSSSCLYFDLPSHSSVTVLNMYLMINLEILPLFVMGGEQPIRQQNFEIMFISISHFIR